MAQLEHVTIWEGVPDGETELQDILDIILKQHADVPQKGGKAKYKNINVRQTTEIGNANIGKSSLSYVMCRFALELESNDDEIVLIEGYVIIYKEQGSTIRYFVDKTSIMAQKILQLLFDNYNKATFVTEIKKEYSADFLFWLFANYMDSDGNLELTTDNLGQSININTINAVRGSMADRITTLTAQSREDIANYISILSFLLETDGVDLLGLSIEYGAHPIVEFVIEKPRINQRVSVNTNSYVGLYDDQPKDDQISLVLLLVHIEVLPQLRGLYSLKEDNWITTQRNEFLKSIGNRIHEKVNSLTSQLENKLKREHEVE